MDSSNDTLGTSGNKWKRVDATDLYGALTGDSNGTHTGNVNGSSSLPYSGDYKVWKAVFN